MSIKIYIQGPQGCGKTFFANRIAQDLMLAGYDVKGEDIGFKNTQLPKTTKPIEIITTSNELTGA